MILNNEITANKDINSTDNKEDIDNNVDLKFEENISKEDKDNLKYTNMNASFNEKS